MTSKKAPIVLAIERDEKGNLSTWCQYCRKFHHHGTGEGHRDAHCFVEDSPYIRTGYVLKKMKLSGREVVTKSEPKQVIRNWFALKIIKCQKKKSLIWNTS